MFTDDQMQTVLLSTSPAPTGHERLVIAFRHGTDVFVPLDRDRPANAELLDATRVYVREMHHQEQYDVCTVVEHGPIGDADRTRIEHHAHRPISDTTEVLHLVVEHDSVESLESEPPGFVAVVDGTDRSAGAIKVAVELAGWYGRPCRVVQVLAGSGDTETATAVEHQLDGTGLDTDDVISITATDLEVALFDLMRVGHVPVASAFGVWSGDGTLPSMFNGLVLHNAPALIGVGPNVVADWEPRGTGPILVCVDASDHAHHLVDELEPFVVPARAKVVVAHIAPAAGAGDAEATEAPTAAARETGIAHLVADEIHARFGIPVQAMTVEDESAAAGIAILSSRLDSRLVITNSWHRPGPGGSPVRSTSLTSVAHAPCPVVILSGEGDHDRPTAPHG